MKKICCNCNKEKPLSAFAVRRCRAKGGGEDIPKTRCIECLNEYAREWYHNNHEKCKDRGAKSMRAQRATNRDRVNEIRREWAKRNKWYENRRTMVRKRGKIESTPKWASKKYIGLWYDFAKIESARTCRKVHVDHIIPVSHDLVCGLHCEDNMQLLFAEDNFKKSNKFEIK